MMTHPDTPTRLYLVRHGSTLWNETRRYQGWADPPLSPRGKREAQQAALQLARVPLQAVYSSDLQRASATARYIVSARTDSTPSVQTSSQLREIRMGLWEGLTYAQIERRWASLVQAWYDDPYVVSPPGGETFSAFRMRVVAFLHRVIAIHRGGAVALVTHGGVIRLMRATIKAVPFQRMWSESVAPGGIRVMMIDTPAALRLNEKPNLQTD